MRDERGRGESERGRRRGRLPGRRRRDHRLDSPVVVRVQPRSVHECIREQFHLTKTQLERVEVPLTSTLGRRPTSPRIPSVAPAPAARLPTRLLCTSPHGPRHRLARRPLAPAPQPAPRRLSPPRRSTSSDVGDEPMATLATADPLDTRTSPPQARRAAPAPGPLSSAFHDSAASASRPAAAPPPPPPPHTAYVLSWTPDSPWRKIPLPPASAFFGASPLVASGAVPHREPDADPPPPLDRVVCSGRARRRRLEDRRVAARAPQDHPAGCVPLSLVGDARAG